MTGKTMGLQQLQLPSYNLDQFEDASLCLHVMCAKPLNKKTFTKRFQPGRSRALATVSGSAPCPKEAGNGDAAGAEAARSDSKRRREPGQAVTGESPVATHRTGGWDNQ